MRRREYIRVGSAETSLFRKLTGVSTLGIQRLFDLTSLGKVSDVLANIYLSACLLDVFEGCTFIAT